MSAGTVNTRTPPLTGRRQPAVRPGVVAATGLTVLAVASAAAIALAHVAGHAIGLGRVAPEDLVWFSAWLLWCPAGLVLARQPDGRRLGLCFTALSAAVLLGGALGTLGRWWLLVDRTPSLAAAGAAALVVARLLADLPSFALLLPLVFPDGRLPSPRWRPVLVVGLVAAGLGVLTDLTGVRPLDDDVPAANPLGLAVAPDLVGIVGAVALVVLCAVLVAGLASLVVRRRRGSAAERAGVTAFGIGASWLLVLALFGWVVGWTGLDIGPAGHAVLQALALLLVPASAVAATVRRVRYGADPLLSRSVTYLVLTVVIVGLYAGLATLAGAALVGRSALGVSLVVTGVVAVALTPAKQALQRVVERVLLGRRSDPYGAMIVLADRIAAIPSPEAALAAATQTVAESLRLPYAAVAVRTGGAPDDPVETVVSEHGDVRAIALTVPLLHGSERVGSLLLAPRTPRDGFSGADQRLVRGFADRLAGTVAVVRLTEELRRSRASLVRAREEERRRVRNELHDGVGPVLASAALALGRASRAFAEDDPRHRSLAEAAEEVRTSIGDVRSLVHDLRPPALDELGLVAAIEQRAARLTDPAATAIAVMAPPLGDLPAAVEVAAYRIVGEALTNIDRHALARRAVVELERTDDRLAIRVVDDGRGVAVDAPAGVGLASMAERAAELGGGLQVRPRADGRPGTEVSAWLPIT